MTTFLLTAVGGTRWQTSIAITADHLLAVVLTGKNHQGRLNDSTTEAQNQMKGAFLLNVIVLEGTAIFQLLTGEDQALLIRRDSFLILDFSLDVVNGIRGFYIQRNGLSSQSLHHLRPHMLDQNIIHLLLSCESTEQPSVPSRISAWSEGERTSTKSQAITFSIRLASWFSAPPPKSPLIRRHGCSCCWHSFQVGACIAFPSIC